MRGARPPTRVSSACDRCRRQKQRCESFRPCSNCVHARAECINSDLPPPLKKARLQKRAQSYGAAVTEFSTDTRYSPDLGERRNEPTARHVPSRPQNIQHDGSPYVQLDPSCDKQQERHGEPQGNSGAEGSQRAERSVFADLGGPDSAMGITKKILGYGSSPSAVDRATFAIPGGESSRMLGPIPSSGRLLPISEIIGVDLPPRQTSDALLDTYFYTVHWFSLVVYEPKFRIHYNNIMDRGLARQSDRAFLLLLLMVLIMGCLYGSGVLPGDTASTAELANMRNTFLTVVRQSFMDLIDEDSLEFVQLCALLGSYWLYWGRPRSSFSILGAATKSSQAIGLHRDSDKRLAIEDAEERKRVWWTIYTWDRFATIIYGRPLGINDKDCNVSMPASYPEDISFTPGGEPARVCVSPYQSQLNTVYQITSPLLENIYGIRYSTDSNLRSQMPDMISKIDELMQAWQRDLPPHLNLEQHGDICLTSSTEEKMHRLQALSLQLTYDNLMIVIHRPLLADQSRKRSRTRKSNQQQDITTDALPGELQYANSIDDTSFQRCLNSALRISRVQQSKRNLIALARKTHLVSFLGMNLFTSSVVMFICALSDTLSDVAQEAKRGMARNLKMLKLLSSDGSLSMQCSMILEDLVQMIVDKEKDAMLLSFPSDDEAESLMPTRRNTLARIDRVAENVDNDAAPQVTWRTNDEPENPPQSINADISGHGGFSLKQTMVSLQKVFKDAATPRPHPTTTSSINEHSNVGQGSQYDHQHQPRWVAHRPDPSGFSFDGFNFNAEDLGQFWLWNMDPITDDATSWHSHDNTSVLQ